MVTSPSLPDPTKARTPGVARSGSPLLRALALAFLGSVVVTTLYPFGPWLSRPGPALDFLFQGLPRYWTGFDVASNLLAYVLLGVLLRVSAIGSRRMGMSTVQVAIFCAALSIGLETLQHWLPQRVPSLLDVLTNSAGGLLGALRDFEARARGAEVALFYFAGHGAQVGGANYLIPVNAPIRSETDVPDEAVDASSALRRIEEGRARVGLVILDACRDNPYPGAARSSTRGLARMSVTTGSKCLAARSLARKGIGGSAGGTRSRLRAAHTMM